MEQEYDTLLRVYRRMFEMVDAFHFNSRITKDVYSRFIEIPHQSSITSITHAGIIDRRQERSFNHNPLRLGFVGSEAPYKGLPLLKSVISRLNKDGFQHLVHLDVYGGRIGADAKLANVAYKGRFSVSQMSDVYNSMDLLVVPSIWNETFGFTVLEALQFGVPVLVSSKVGSKDIVEKLSNRFVFRTEEDLFFILKSLLFERSLLEDYNRRLLEERWVWDMSTHSRIIENQYYHESNPS